MSRGTVCSVILFNGANSMRHGGYGFLGRIDDISVGDSINTYGEVVFWVGSESGDQAIFLVCLEGADCEKR